MELRHLEAFAAVAAERSFTKAAQRLHLSQPPLTRLIQQLEKELGVTLFHRHRRGVDLTPHGELLLDKARCLVAQAHDFLSTVRRDDTTESGIVRLGIARGLHEVALAVHARHAERFPGVTLDVEDIASDRQEDALRRQEIDVGISRQAPISKKLRVERLFDERFVVLLNEDNPLARKKRLTLKAVAAQPLLRGPDISDTIYKRILHLYAQVGVKPVELPASSGLIDETSIRIQVASGKSICIVLWSNVTRLPAAGGIAVVPLDEPDATNPVWMVWRAGETSRVVLQFLDTVRQFRSDHSSDLKQYAFEQIRPDAGIVVSVPRRKPKTLSVRPRA